MTGRRDRFEVTGQHPGHGDGAGQQVAAVGRIHHCPRHRTDLVPGAPDPLQSRRDRRRTLDLHHEVDGPHIDAQFQAAGGDHGPQPAGLQVVLDLAAAFLAHTAVVGARQ